MGSIKPPMKVDLAGGLCNAQGMFRDRPGQQVCKSQGVSCESWDLICVSKDFFFLKNHIIRVIYVSYKKKKHRIKQNSHPSSLTFSLL